MEAEAGLVESTGIGQGDVLLFSYWRSSCSWRVRICLELKGIKYKYAAVHLVKDGGENKEKLAKLNPMKQVPALVIDGITLSQSVAIAEYLEETRPPGTGGGEKLLPDDPKQRAMVRQIVEVINSGIQPVQNTAVLIEVDKLVPAKRMEWGKMFIERGFDALEELLRHEKNQGRFCVGDKLSLADCFLVPQVYNANRFGVDMSKYPIISKINENLSGLEAFKRAHPSNQPDAE